MQVSRPTVGVLTAALVTLTLTACGESAKNSGTPDTGSNRTTGATDSSPTTEPTEGDVWHDAVSPADAGGRVGADDSPCPLPVTFDVAAGWQPAALDPGGADGDFAAMTHNGSFTVACEINAGPAGPIGHLRVWVSDEQPQDLEEALAAFLDEDVSGKISEEHYRETRAGDLNSVEATVLAYSDVLEEQRRTRGFVVPTPEGATVVEYTGFDLIEHDAMVPGYLLARDSIQRTG